MNGNGNGSIWRYVATALATLLFSVGGVYLTSGLSAIDRAEAEQIVLDTSPYLRDRARILDAVSRVDRLEGTSHQIDLMSDRLSTLEISNAKLLERIDIILKALEVKE